MNSESNKQPAIVKYVEPQRSGIHQQQLKRHAIGFIIRGQKDIFYGDERYVVNKGDLFYLSSGHHYIENIPEDSKPFEQIVFYFTPQQLSSIITQLSMNYGLSFTNDHSCQNCHGKSHVVYPAWNTAKSFFASVSQYIKDGVFTPDSVAENLKMTELVYLMFSRTDCCIKSKVLEHTDHIKESFEQIMYKNIFNDISIEELARLCNRSLTSFKKEFKKHFHESPHKWFIKQRLMHSRMKLISTSKSISEIGMESNFPNTSHFIKLFKKEYDMTPANYRTRHNESGKHELKAELKYQ